MLTTPSPASLELPSRHRGALFRGDNLAILREQIPDESVDLVYLDPPFQSGRNYSVAFALKSGRKPTSQMQAFEDTWQWGPESDGAYREVMQQGGRPSVIMAALRRLFGESDIMAYLCMMAPRLIELRRVVKPTGSIWLHCDPTASHYLKLLMDAIWGSDCFRNEVIWRYRRWPAKARQLQKMHDVLLYYSRSPDGKHTFHSLYGYESLAESTLKTFGTKRQRADFSSGYRKPGIESAESLGPPLSDVWDIGVIAAIGRERLGYPTQKPEALLERVILTASNEGDVVLDPFCGSGTAIAVAHRLRRRWIGIDITHLAISLVKHRLKSTFDPSLPVDVIGEPTTVEDARRLASSHPYQFGCWILGLLGARSTDKKRGTDSGIDGRLFFHDSRARSMKAKQVLLALRSEEPSAADVRALREALEREGAAMAALLTLLPPAGDVLQEAARAGFYSTAGAMRPRIQILTVADILAGKRVLVPPAPDDACAYEKTAATICAGPRSRPGITQARPRRNAPKLATTNMAQAVAGRPGHR